MHSFAVGAYAHLGRSKSGVGSVGMVACGVVPYGRSALQLAKGDESDITPPETCAVFVILWRGWSAADTRGQRIIVNSFWGARSGINPEGTYSDRQRPRIRLWLRESPAAYKDCCRRRLKEVQPRSVRREVFQRVAKRSPGIVKAVAAGIIHVFLRIS